MLARVASAHQIHVEPHSGAVAEMARVTSRLSTLKVSAGADSHLQQQRRRVPAARSADDEEKEPHNSTGVINGLDSSSGMDLDRGQGRKRGRQDLEVATPAPASRPPTAPVAPSQIQQSHSHSHSQPLSAAAAHSHEHDRDLDLDVDALGHSHATAAVTPVHASKVPTHTKSQPAAPAPAADDAMFESDSEREAKDGDAATSVKTDAQRCADKGLKFNASTCGKLLYKNKVWKQCSKGIKADGRCHIALHARSNDDEEDE